MKEYKDSRIAKYIVSGVVIIIAALMTFIVYEIVHIEKYETTLTKNIGKYKGAFYYEMALFPKNNIKEDSVVTYKYKHIASILDDSQYILMTYQYAEDYQDEKERLSAIKNEYGSVTYSDSKFELPAYIYMYNEGDNSEFALVDDVKKQITYVYIQCPFDFEGERYIE